MTLLTCFCAGEQTRLQCAGGSEVSSWGLESQYPWSSIPQEIFSFLLSYIVPPIFPSLLSRNRLKYWDGKWSFSKALPRPPWPCLGPSGHIVRCGQPQVLVDWARVGHLRQVDSFPQEIWIDSKSFCSVCDTPFPPLGHSDQKQKCGKEEKRRRSTERHRSRETAQRCLRNPSPPWTSS